MFVSVRVRVAAPGARGSPSRSAGPSRPQNSWRWVGGSGRQHTLLMEIQLTKVKRMCDEHLWQETDSSVTTSCFFRSVSSTRRTWWWCPLCRVRTQRGWGLVNSLYPVRCLSFRSWRCETDWLPLKLTSSCICTPVRACHAEHTPTW